MEKFLLLLVLLFASNDAQLDSRIKTVDQPIADKYIVVFKDTSDVNVDVDQISAITGRPNIGRVFRNVLKGVTVRVRDPRKLTQILDLLTIVDYVQQDGIVNITAPIDDNSRAMTWGLDRINQRDLPLDGSALFTGDGSGVNVYIIDTGIYPGHEYFGGRASVGFDAVEIDDQQGIDCNGHGTHCAGTIGADYYGIARGSNLYGVRVLSCEGWGEWSWVFAGMDWVAANHVAPAVASMSLGGGANQAANDAVRNLYEAGVTVVVAAGNSNGDSCLLSPASEPLAITVGATDHRDHRASFSSFGSCVDIFAPGVNVLSTYIGRPTSTLTASGTSMACPHVAGIAALALGNDNTLTPKDVWDKLSGDATGGKVQNKGVLSPDKLLYSAPKNMKPYVNVAKQLVLKNKNN